MKNKVFMKRMCIVGGAFALTVIAAAPIMQVVSKASPSNKVVVQEATATVQEDGVYSWYPNAIYDDEMCTYSKLATIKSKVYNYEDVKDKTVVLWYNSNNARDGYAVMNMNVEELASDEVTPKTVSFSCDVETIENADIAYTVLGFAEENLSMIGRATDVGYDEYDKNILEKGYLDTGFDEKENPNKVVVNLRTAPLYRTKVTLNEEYLYTKCTYKVNGGEEKTVFAKLNSKIKEDTAIVEYYTFEVPVYANVGDVVEYAVEIPTEDGMYIQTNKATVQE